MITEIKKFGENELKLNFDGSFEKFSDDDFSCNWVYACYKDKMESFFGNDEPFEFYSNFEEAKNRKKALDDMGCDTYLFSAEAHGGKSCPITKELVSAELQRQCYVVLHEGWHSTVRLKDYNFNYSYEESTGRIVGLFGAIEFAKKIGDDSFLKKAEEQEKAWSIMAEFVNQSFIEINECLKNNKDINLLKKELNRKATLLQNDMPDSWEKSELSKEINNAFILRYHDYTVYYKIAKDIFNEDKNLQNSMNRFVTLAEKLEMLR